MSAFITNDPAETRVLPALLTTEPVMRDRLVSRLVRSRRSVLVICAPSLYGKSVLAFTYARLQYGIYRFHWIDGRDPRFLTCLQDESLFWNRLDHEAKRLLVFDEVPFLGKEDAKAFSRLVAHARNRRWEVVITTRDSELDNCLNGAKEVIRANDLLLDDVELSEHLGDVRDWSREYQVELRIPCMGFGGVRARERFVASLSEQPIRNEVEKVAMASLIMGAGSLGDLLEVTGTTTQARELQQELYRNYPHAGVRIGVRTVVPFDLFEHERLTLATTLVGAWGPEDGDTLVLRLSSHAYDVGRTLLAALMVANLCGPQSVRIFLTRWGRSLLWDAHPAALYELTGALGDGPGNSSSSLLRVLALRALGEGRRADTLLTAVLDRCTNPVTRSACALIGAFSEQGIVDSWWDQAVLSLTYLAESDLGLGDITQLSLLSFGCDSDRGARNLCTVGKVVVQGWDHVLSLLEECFCKVQDDAFLQVLTACVLIAAAHMHEPLSAAQAAGIVTEVDQVLLSASCAPPCISHLLLACALKANPELSCRVMSDVEILDLAKKVRERISAQRALEARSFGRQPLVASGRRDSSWSSGVVQKNPSCSLRIFGAFELADTQGQPVSVREKARLLIVFMVLNHGQQVSRTWLERALWPDSDARLARASLYELWSYAARTLASSSGQPVLVRNRETLSMEESVLDLDIVHLEEALRRFPSPQVSIPELTVLFHEIRDRFGTNLLPGIRNEKLEYYREMWNKQVVDALMTAVERLLATGDLRLLEEILSYAFLLDPTREDVCLALMETQCSLGCHAAATATFVRCQKASSERHGIGVTKRLRQAYQNVIEQVA